LNEETRIEKETAAGNGRRSFFRMYTGRSCGLHRIAEKNDCINGCRTREKAPELS
jgi:hypothetical protein